MNRGHTSDLEVWMIARLLYVCGLLLGLGGGWSVATDEPFHWDKLIPALLVSFMAMVLGWLVGEAEAGE